MSVELWYVNFLTLLSIIFSISYCCFFKNSVSIRNSSLFNYYMELFMKYWILLWIRLWVFIGYNNHMKTLGRCAILRLCAPDKPQLYLNCLFDESLTFIFVTYVYFVLESTVNIRFHGRLERFYPYRWLLYPYSSWFDCRFR